MHVGVFPYESLEKAEVVSLPHARGGVSSLNSWRYTQPKVFPMHVGVFLTEKGGPFMQLCLPHARGGVSSYLFR